MIQLFQKKATLKKISIKKMETLYKLNCQFSILDYVEKFHTGLEYIELNICEKTGSKYYTPRRFYGNEEYYRVITSSPGYYKKERWEWHFVLKLLHFNTKVLEIGCGKGDFIKKANALGHTLVGIEPSQTPSENTFKETIEQHISNNPKIKYDAIVSFHVLEHIADINNFFRNIKHLLKEGGDLFVAIPNNKSFIGKDPLDIMNMPPHHMNLWTPNSIRETLLIYGFYDIEVIENTIPPDHYQWYCQVIYNRLRDKLGLVGRVLSKVIRPMIMILLRMRVYKPIAAEMLVKASSR